MCKDDFGIDSPINYDEEIFEIEEPDLEEWYIGKMEEEIDDFMDWEELCAKN